MGGSKNKAGAKKIAKPELQPLITDTKVGGIQGYGDVETPCDSEEMGSIGYIGGNLSREEGNTGQMMVEDRDAENMESSLKVSEKWN